MYIIMILNNILPINKIYISMLNNKYKIHNNYLIFFLLKKLKLLGVLGDIYKDSGWGLVV